MPNKSMPFCRPASAPETAATNTATSSKVKLTPAVSHIDRSPASPLLPKAESPEAKRKLSYQSGANDNQVLPNVVKPTAGTISSSLTTNEFQPHERVHAMPESSAFAKPAAA
jgi:hypothetical protein